MTTDPYAHLRQHINRGIAGADAAVTVPEPAPAEPASADVEWAHELIEQGYSPEHVERRTGILVVL